MKIELERFVDSCVLSSMSSIEFLTDIGSDIWRRERKWSAVREVYNCETDTIRVADSVDELLDMFAADEDVKALRETLLMPHVLSVGFNMYNGAFNVNACVALRMVDLPDAVMSDASRWSNGNIHIVVSESSMWHRIAPLHALRRYIAIDSTPIDVWRSVMRHRGYDVRLVRNDGTFSVLVYDIADADDDNRKPKYATRGPTPYEALAPWRLFVSDNAADRFDDDAD